MQKDRLVAIHNFPIWLPQTQTWMYIQVKSMSKDADIHVVCERTRHLDQFALANIHCLSETSRLQYFKERIIRRSVNPFYRGYLSRVAKEVDADILHSHFGPVGWADIQTAKKQRMKHIVTFYGYDVRMLPSSNSRWLARYRQLFEMVDLILCEGPHMAREIIQLGCPQDKVNVHHLGIEINRFPYEPRSWQAGEPLKVLIVASFREKKGIPYALQALSQLQSVVPLEITIIGDADGEERSKKEKKLILSTIEENGMNPRIRLLGYQPYARVIQEAYNHHIFISPSICAKDGDTEGGAPITLIEMVASGMPVVSTLHCDIPEVVEYGMSDWLVEERNIAGLVERLLWLVQHSGEWDNFLSVGRKHVEKEFNAIQQGKNLLAIYKELVS